MDFSVHNTIDAGEIPAFQRQAKEKFIPEKKLKIHHIVANIFIEIANFFKRFLCCSKPFELYTVENCRSRATELALTPDSDDEEFFNEFGKAYSFRENEGEIQDGIEIESIRSSSASPVVFERSEEIKNLFTELQSCSLNTKEISTLFQRIVTQEDAIEFIDLCIAKYPWIKEDYPEEHSVREDYLRKLALSTKERPNSSESKEIMAAFEARGLIYENYLPKNHLTKLVALFNFAFYKEIPLQDLTRLSLTQKEIKATIEAYEAPELFDVCLNLLIELGDIIQASELERNSKEKSKYLRVKTKNTLAWQHYHSKLSSLLVDLKPKFLEIEKSLKNNLLEYLISDKSPRISSKCVELQQKVLELFFDHGSFDQLSRFIHSAVYIRKEFACSNCYDLVVGEFNLCFFNELTGERQEKLLPLLEIENTKIDETIMHCLMSLIDGNNLNRKYSPNEVIEFAQDLGSLSKKLVSDFYKKRPNSELWNKILEQDSVEGRNLRASLAETKILFLMTECLESPNLEQEKKFCKLSEEIKDCFKIFPDDFQAHYLVEKSIKKILLKICEYYEAFGKETAEKILTAFVQAITHKEEYCEKLLSNSNYSMGKNLKFGALWLSGWEALTVSVMFQSWVDRHYIWYHALLGNLWSEGQMNAFIDFCLGLPEPLQTIQLHSLKSQCSRYPHDGKEINKILEVRNIELVADPDQDWASWQIYDNAFEMKKIFDDLLALNSQVDMERWIVNKKKSVEFLQALAAGIELTDGRIIKCPLHSKEIKQAFQENNLDYQIYAKPIALYDFLSREYT